MPSIRGAAHKKGLRTCQAATAALTEGFPAGKIAITKGTRVNKQKNQAKKASEPFIGGANRPSADANGISASLCQGSWSAEDRVLALEQRVGELNGALGFLERLAKDPSSEQLLGDLLGALEKSLGSAAWVLSTRACGSWRLAGGPSAHRQATSCSARARKMFGEAGAGDVRQWLMEIGFKERPLDEVAVSGVALSTSVWTPGGLAAESGEASSLMRALRSALAGLEKARQEREALLLDPMTKMLSRQGFIEKAQEAQEAGGFEMAVYLVDLAGFARVNSALGHEIGDEIIVEAGTRIKSFAGVWPCARLGSDAFAMIMPASAYCPKAFETLFEEPMMTSILPIPMLARVAATFVEAGESAGTWLTRTAAAMEEAKIAGLSGGEPRWFDEGSEAAALERMAISQKLFVALRDRVGLFMVFQPQVSLADGALTGCEALIRWMDNGALVPPDKFVPIAEQSGLALAISEFALSESLAMMRRARAGGHALPRVSVNLSPVEFESGDLVARVGGHLAKEGCDPSDLMIEITETAAARDPERMGLALKGLRERGIKVAIDDFGSGYSSLAQLAKLPIDELKIDRAFVGALGQEGPFSRIARMIVDLGESMLLEVVAEGVESAEQARMLADMGAHSAQGWAYARGMPENEFFDWMAARSATMANGGAGSDGMPP